MVCQVLHDGMYNATGGPLTFVKSVCLSAPSKKTIGEMYIYVYIYETMVHMHCRPSSFHPPVGPPGI